MRTQAPWPPVGFGARMTQRPAGVALLVHGADRQEALGVGRNRQRLRRARRAPVAGALDLLAAAKLAAVIGAVDWTTS